MFHPIAKCWDPHLPKSLSMVWHWAQEQWYTSNCSPPIRPQIRNKTCSVTCELLPQVIWHGCKIVCYKTEHIIRFWKSSRDCAYSFSNGLRNLSIKVKIELIMKWLSFSYHWPILAFLLQCSLSSSMRDLLPLMIQHVWCRLSPGPGYTFIFSQGLLLRICSSPWRLKKIPHRFIAYNSDVRMRNHLEYLATWFALQAFYKPPSPHISYNG